MKLLTPEVQRLAESYMASLDCARSLSIVIMMRYGEWSQIVNLDCDASNFVDAESYLQWVSATDFLRKFEARIPGVDPEAAALQKWREAEAMCFHTNRRLNEIMDFGTLSGVPVPDWLEAFLSRARKNLIQLIGEAPPSVFDGAFGPGATMSDSSRWTTIPNKLSTNPTLTPLAAFHLVPWTGTKWAQALAARRGDVSFVRGNVYFSVPKTAKVSRACAKEPSLNAYYQLGLGRIMRKRMKSQGIDLDKGQDVHRQVACAASQSGEFCTIDLSSASDTISEALVRLLLPRGWLDPLTQLRSPFTRVNGVWHRLEKFSSMGNGFTFELETAIFCSIVMACSELLIPGVNLWVYGDDIIAPNGLALDVIRALEFFGFKTNSKKTFFTGVFRESCGGDYFGGRPVRAHYLKESPNEPQQIISLANGIRRVSHQFVEGSPVRARLLSTWHRCIDLLPSSIRACRGPQELGDIVIHDDESRWSTRWRSSGIRYVRVYRPAVFRRVRFDRFDPEVQFAAALYGVYLSAGKSPERWGPFEDRRGLTLRDGVEGYKVGWTPFS